MILQFTKILIILVVSANIAFGEPLDGDDIPPSPTTDLPAPLSTDIAPPPNDVTTLTPSWQMTPIPKTDPAPQFGRLTLAAKGWFVRGDAMFLNLSRGSEQPLADEIVSANGTLGAFGPVLSTNNISSQQTAAVPRIAIGYRHDNGTSVEATYFGRNDWSGSAFAASSPNAVPAILFLVSPDGLLVNNVSASLSSVLNSAELNAFQPIPALRSLEFLAGLRYFGLSEHFQFNGQRQTTRGLLTSDYDLQTGNNLYGGQLGLRWTSVWNKLSLTGAVKTGVYGNAASQNQFFDYRRNGNELQVRNFWQTQPSAAFIQELGFNGVCQLTEGWSIRAGYNLFIINGLARVNDQIDFSSNPLSAFSTHGTAVLHGPSAGIEIRF